MKSMMLVLLMLVSAAFSAQGQCVIYADNSVGAFGIGYNKDNTPTTWAQCEEQALKNCQATGGRNCTLVQKIDKAGWCALIKGKLSDGRNLFQGADGVSSQSKAEKAVKERYRNAGGVNVTSAKVYSWRVYAPPKKK
jgi:hypothetical protein